MPFVTAIGVAVLRWSYSAVINFRFDGGNFCRFVFGWFPYLACDTICLGLVVFLIFSFSIFFIIFLSFRLTFNCSHFHFVFKIFMQKKFWNEKIKKNIKQNQFVGRACRRWSKLTTVATAKSNRYCSSLNTNWILITDWRPTTIGHSCALSNSYMFASNMFHRTCLMLNSFVPLKMKLLFICRVLSLPWIVNVRFVHRRLWMN